MDSAGLRWRVANGGVSGETSAGALRRLEWVLDPDVKVLVVETGANDGLRGLDPDSTRANIEAIVRRARAADPGVRIVLAGMEAPPNLGAAYTARFRAHLPRPRAPRAAGADPVPPRRAWAAWTRSTRADGIHPNAAGARIVAANVWRVLEPELTGGGADAPDATGAPRSPLRS